LVNVATNPLKVVIFSSVPPQRVERIISRIRRDAPEAQVVGVLYAKFPRKSVKQRMTTWRKKMKRPVYWRYVLHRMSATVGKKVSAAGDSLIRSQRKSGLQPGRPGGVLPKKRSAVLTGG
jgi:hypothetical protein